MDGETEVWYLQLLREHESIKNTTIRPEIPREKELSEQYELVKDNAKDYFKVIWLIDLDTLLKEDREAQIGKKSKIVELNEYSLELRKLENVHVLINTPCLEFWHLLHFKDTGKYYSDCKSVIRVLKKNGLSDYEKSQEYYKKKNNDIYLKLKPNKATAMANAEKLGNFSAENPHTAKAEIYRIFSLLGIE